jgi:glycosyltransferase involved in cell wall biosynthesis
MISVIIPCYNDGKYLPETISKLKLQTLPANEIIIVNDGSTDTETIDILNQLEKDPLIQILHKENGRMSAARNYGVAHAKGDIIVALDADDYFDPSFFKKAMDVLNNEPTTGVVTSYIRYFGNKKGSAKPRGGNAFNFLLLNNGIFTSLLFHHSVIGSASCLSIPMIFEFIVLFIVCIFLVFLAFSI